MILTVKAIEGTGMIEDGQVLITVLFTFGNGILREAAPGAGWTDKSPHTICRESVVVERQISLVGAASTYLAVFHATEATEAHSLFRYPALVEAERTCDSILGPGRVLWKTIRPAGANVNPLDLRPNLVEILPDAVGTKANHIRDGSSALAAISA
jgi:hypothetical protein